MTRRFRFQISGIVQGVGFRPFIYRLATAHDLAGLVRNAAHGVTVEVEGAGPAIESFLSRMQEQTPPLAEIYGIGSSEVEPTGEQGFRIEESATQGPRDVQISPDIATCDECIAELFTPSDRRHGYPFVNCTNCGPRLTIIRDIPYDRVRTSMAAFPLCERCAREYKDPADRRFHAEPNACPECGPRLRLLNAKGSPVRVDDVVGEAARLIRKGGILAVKGLGGFHLCADACSDDAMGRLRKRKFREEKPLAVMVRDADAAADLALLTDGERRVLLSPARPIVLAAARKDSPLSALVAPGMGTVGIMLPYTPLHHLLLARGFTALVMTSANQTDEPICIDNDEAVERLSGIVDAFLVHDRDIVVRCDDSVAMATGGGTCLLRRSRGYAPRPVLLPEPLPGVLALGGHLKSTVCIVRDDKAYLSPHVGDLETPLARDFLHETVEVMQRVVQSAPSVVACDLHPRYYSTRVASMLGAKDVIRVQHHHAHIVSCMAENRITGRVIGLSMDGTGYGDDGHIWGGEFLVADEGVYDRAGHLKYLALPGGEAAIRQPWRFAVSLLRDAYADQWPDVASLLGIVPQGVSYESLGHIMEAGLNSPLTSSLGRLFDAVATILDIKRVVSFEGQAPMFLEAAARSGRGDALPFAIHHEGELSILDMVPAVRALVEGSLAGTHIPDLAYAFHATISAACADMADLLRDRTGINRVVLSGGCFQNRILLAGCTEALEAGGFEVFTHHRVPPNDGGISLGQAVVAGNILKNRKKG